METSNKIAIVISILSLFVSGYIGYIFANKSFKKQARLSEINSLIKNKKELIDNLGALSIVGTQIAVKEYNMIPDKLGSIPEPMQEKYWTSVYNGHDFDELYLIIGELSRLNFEKILKEIDPSLLEHYKLLKALRTNKYMAKAERAHMVFQICFINKLAPKIERIDDEFIMQKYKANM